MAQDTGSAPAEILHTATVVLTVLLLSAVAALAAIVVTWTAAHIIRTRRAHRQAVLRLIPPNAGQGAGRGVSEPGATRSGIHAVESRDCKQQNPPRRNCDPAVGN
jgi:hypothetical protein